MTRLFEEKNYPTEFFMKGLFHGSCHIGFDPQKNVWQQTNTRTHTHFKFWTFAHKLLSRVHDRRERERICVCACVRERARDRDSTVHTQGSRCLSYCVWANTIEWENGFNKRFSQKVVTYRTYLTILGFIWCCFFSVVTTIASLWQYN